MYWYTRYYAKKIDSSALLADAWHHRSDAFSSIGALIGIAGARLGFPVMDSVASLVIFVFIVKAALDIFKDAMDKIGITGMTVSHVLGYGTQGGKVNYYRGVKVETNLLPKIQVDIVVSNVPVQSVIDAAKSALYTGHIGDGKIFIYDVEEVIKIRTGEINSKALTDTAE